MTTPHELRALRSTIDDIDSAMLKLLGQRQKAVAQVIAVKAKHGLAARLPDRVDEVIDGVARQAPSAGVDPDLARAVWTTIVEWFIAHEERALAQRRG